MSDDYYVDSLAAERDRWRVRAESAERRVAELETAAAQHAMNENYTEEGQRVLLAIARRAESAEAALRQIAKDDWDSPDWASAVARDALAAASPEETT